jgi:ribonucleoside-diphosphate reductase alpha chain
MPKKVIKRDGSLEDFNPSRIERAILKALNAVNYEGNREKVSKDLADEVVKKIEGRFGESYPSVEQIQDIVEETLMSKGLAKVAKAYILYRHERKRVRDVKKFVGIKDDLKLTINAARVLEKRYLLRDEKGNIVETPREMFRRVAKTIAKPDLTYNLNADLQKIENEFYHAMIKFLFLPNSPTLMNAGTTLGQLSACFVLPVEDSIEGIFETLKLAMLIQKTGGGTGFSFSKIRPKGDIVMSTGGIASGPVSFIRVYNCATGEIKQGGRRRGANMAILSVHHPDILEFITCKAKGGIENFNLSVGLTDEFMRAYEADDYYELINPRNGKVVRKLRARDVFDMICHYAWATGDPGLLFLDEVNKHNPTPRLGKIEATNPCVTRDTLVITSRGFVRADEIKVGDKVWSGNRWNTVTKVFNNGIKPVYRITLANGKVLKVTKEHKLLVLEKGQSLPKWKQVKDIKVGEMVRVLNNLPDFPDSKPKVSLEQAELIGLLARDGFLSKKDGREKVGFSVEEDEEVIDFIRSNLKKFSKWVRTCTTDKGKHELKFVHSLRVTNWLSSYCDIKELAGDSSEKVVPKVILESNFEVQKAFLKGLFTSDGTIYNEKGTITITLNSSSEKLVQQAALMLEALGIQANILVNKRRKIEEKLCKIKPNYRLRLCNSKARKFIEEIGFKGRKQAKAVKMLSKMKRGNHKHVLNDYIKVKKIEYIGREIVYDIYAPEEMVWITNGIYSLDCGELPLLPYESCNLGSINLSKVVKNGEIDWDLLRDLVWLSVHFLDNVIDANVYVVKEIEEITKANRKIGLGVMGFAHALIKLGIPYNTKEALDIAEKIMSFISKEGHDASEKLAEQRGTFPNFEDSVWAKRRAKMRNATVTTIAPTGSISIIAGTSSSIEPLFAVVYVRNVLGGSQLIEVDPLFEEISKKRGFYSSDLMSKIAKKGTISKFTEIPKDVRRLFVTALEISPEWHVKMQAAFQKHTDNSVSKTVNLREDAGIEDVKNAFLLAYKLKCKGITVYRYGSKKEQVLYLGSLEKLGEEKNVIAESEYSGGCPLPMCQ